MMDDTGREVSVSPPKSSRDVGGCNGCTAHTTADGMQPHDVRELRFRGATVRVCSTCFYLLGALIGAVTAPSRSSTR